MDQFDRKILAEIQQNADLTVNELASAVGLSPTPCWRRLKSLEERGVIRGRAVLLDPRKIGLLVNVFAYIKIARHDEIMLERFEDEIKSIPEIVECFSMGGDSDYLLRIVTTSIEDYEQFLKKTLLHLPGVAGVNSSFVLKPVKIATALPLPR